MKIDINKPFDEQTRIIEIAGRTFEIPIEFLNGRLDKGRVQDGVNLHFVYPDFSSRLRLKNKAEYDALLKARHMGSLLIKIADERPDLVVSYQNLRNSVADIKMEDDQYGLRKETWFRIRDGKTMPYYEAYAELGENGELLSFLLCQIHREEVSQACGHRFFDKGVAYDLHYNKKNYMSEWRSMRSRAIKSIDNFEMIEGKER